MENLIKDIRYGVRMLTKNPGVTLVAVITLALGIGANTAIFSGVSAFLMRPLSVPNPGGLVRPMEIAEDRGVTDEFSYPDFVDYRDQSTSFSGLAAEDMLQAAIDAENQNDVIWGQVVSANYFDVLEVKPILGRTFLPDEDKNVGANAVVVLSHSFWQRRLGSDPNIVGKTVQLNNRAYEVIGVTPEYFVGTKFALALDFWTPMSMAEDLRRKPGPTQGTRRALDERHRTSQARCLNLTSVRGDVSDRNSFESGLSGQSRLQHTGTGAL